MQLIRMVLHHDAAATVVEFISDAGDIANAVMSRLPEDVILPSRVRYTVVKPSKGGQDDGDAFDQLLSLGENDAPVLADKASPADLLVFSHQVQDADTLERLVSLAIQQLAKPGVTVIVAASNQAAASRLAAKGFQIVSDFPDGKALALYSHKEPRTEATAKASPKHQVVVVLPTKVDSETKVFSSKLQETFRRQGHSVLARSWGDGISPDDVKGKTCVSLLELAQPLLENLSRNDFESLRTAVLHSERLLWITSGDNPSFGMVDGFARCIRSEIAGTKFQLLHLSEATGLQHGPSLAARILDSDSNDDEYREVGGVLQVGRIFKSYQQNESVRHHLEDTTRVLTLADQDDALRLTIGKPGLLDTLRFSSDERMLRPLQDHEVEIQVKATGLK